MQRSVLSLAVGFFSFVASAQAQVLTLPEGTTGLTPLEGRVKSVEQVRIPVSDTVTGAETRVIHAQWLFRFADALDFPLRGTGKPRHDLRHGTERS
jgi:hypothetical protein